MSTCVQCPVAPKLCVWSGNRVAMRRWRWNVVVCGDRSFIVQVNRTGGVNRALPVSECVIPNDDTQALSKQGYLLCIFALNVLLLNELLVLKTSTTWLSTCSGYAMAHSAPLPAQKLFSQTLLWEFYLSPSKFHSISQPFFSSNHQNDKNNHFHYDIKFCNFIYRYTFSNNKWLFTDSLINGFNQSFILFSIYKWNYTNECRIFGQNVEKCPYSMGVIFVWKSS